jgi:tetratricopeptide (TPR) repeat protein
MWSGNFLSLVQCVLRQLGTDKDATLWIDIFCFNHHDVTRLNVSIWNSSFLKLIGSIGRTIVVLFPDYLHRTWCLYELYCTAISNCQVDIVMPSNDSDTFERDIDTNPVDTMCIWSKVDVLNSSSHHSQDHAVLLAAISWTIGIDDFNFGVKCLLQQWMIHYIRHSVSLSDISGDVALNRLRSLGAALCAEGPVTQEAVDVHQEALTLAMSLYGSTSMDAATSIRQTCLACYDIRTPAHAPFILPMLHQALQIYETQQQQQENEERMIAIPRGEVMCDIARVYLSQGSSEEALVWFDHAAVLFHDTQTIDPYMERDIGLAHSLRGNSSSAIEHYQRALVLFKSMGTRGENSSEVSHCWNLIGMTYFRTGQHQLALENFTECLKAREASLGDGDIHPSVADALNNLGMTLSSLSDYPQAMEMHQRALTIRTQLYAHAHPSVSESLHNIGVVYYRLKNYEDAIAALSSSLEISQEFYADNDPAFLPSFIGLADVYAALGDNFMEAQWRDRAAVIGAAVVDEGIIS